jgi:calmodulin
MLRIMRQVPTDDEVFQLIDEVNPDKKLNMDFYQFIKIVAANMRDPDDIAEEIKKAFKAIDRQKKGYLLIAELRDFLTNIGDYLNDEEVDEMIKIADFDQSGQINYEKFVETMLLMKTEKKKKKKGKKIKKKK